MKELEEETVWAHVPAEGAASEEERESDDVNSEDQNDAFHARQEMPHFGIGKIRGHPLRHPVHPPPCDNRVKECYRKEYWRDDEFKPTTAKRHAED